AGALILRPTRLRLRGLLSLPTRHLSRADARLVVCSTAVWRNTVRTTAVQLFNFQFRSLEQHGAQNADLQRRGRKRSAFENHTDYARIDLSCQGFLCKLFSRARGDTQFSLQPCSCAGICSQMKLRACQMM